MLPTVLKSLLLFSFSSLAMATPVEDARNHIDAIVKGDLNTLVGNYSPDAVFQWVGGPLNGRYTDTQSINKVWTKFVTKVAPKNVTILSLTESTNPLGSTVNAKVVFKGKKNIKVDYIMLYRDGKLVNEIWQIAPQMAIDY